MYALLNRKNGVGRHSEACQLVADFSPGEENSSEEAYNNPVCVQGQVIPPVLGFGIDGSADERLTTKGHERLLFW